ncbi:MULTISPECIES: hypothetical protein [unclassified Nocardia]|uniref:hypothetical protein n=1 Tax=unclassified Nocardia TaxID=2637762 RepID=UPI0024A7E098|nr:MULTISPECIES: hypothetical protein [unclassified Nocardia]
MHGHRDRALGASGGSRGAAALTITLSKVLADTGITGVSVDPGFVQTDFSPINRAQAPLTAAQGAEPVVAAAMRTIDAASGSFVSRDGMVPW